MKEIKKYRIKRAFGVYRVGDIIQPTNAMWRDELKTNGWIESVADEPAHVVEPEPEPAPVDDISDDEDDVLIETAISVDTETADLPRGRRGRHGR